MESTKGRVTFWLGMAVTVFFFGWALVKFDFTAVWEALRKANYIWVIPAAIIETLLIFMRAARWRYFLHPVKPVSLNSASSATAIGFLANMILPARIGEFIRAWAIGKKEGISKTASFGSIVIERAIDGLSVVVIVIFLILFVDVPESQQKYWNALKATGYAVSAFYLLFFVMLLLFHKRVKLVEWIIDTCLGVAPERFGVKIRHILESFRSGFDALENGHHIFAIFIWSIVFWSVAGGLNIAFFYAFGLYSLPFIATYLILMSQVFGSMLPSSPGFVGPYHAATVAGLLFYGVDEELALSMAIVMHATMFFTNTVPGVVYLWLEKMSFSELKRSAEEEET